MTKTIGEKILELRKARSLTQEKLGEQLGISSQAVSKWENGDSMPDIMILPQLCEILGISIDSLLEVPVSMKKENILKSFRSYADEVGTSKALIEAFISCAQTNKPFDINDVNNPNGLFFKYANNFMEIVEASGFGFVLSNNEFMDKIRDYDVQKLVNFFEMFANEDIMTVVKELLIAGYLTKEDLLNKTNLSIEIINQVLLILMERDMCKFFHQNIINKDVYTIEITSHALHMTLTAYFMSHSQNKSNNTYMFVHS